jgi:hypothetical protein
MEKFYLRNKKDFVCLGKKKSKAELSLWQAVQDHRVVRRKGSYIF